MSQSDIDCFGSYRGYVLRTKKVDRNEKKGEVDTLRTLLSLNMNRLCSIGEHKPEMYSVSQQVGEIIRTHSDYGFIRQKKNGPAIPHTRAILIPIQEVGNVDKDKGVGFTLLMATDWSMVCSPAWICYRARTSTDEQGAISVLLS